MKVFIGILLLCLAGSFRAQSLLPLESFLQSVGTHQIVGLGEQRHGVETFNDIKSSFLSAASRNYPESNLLVESSFNLSMVHFLTRGDMPDWGNNVLFQFWNTDSVLRAMAHFNSRSQTLKRPALAGFDMSEDCRFELTTSYLIQSGWVVKTVHALRSADSIMSQAMAPHVVKQKLSMQERWTLYDLYDRIELEIMDKDSSMKRDIVLRMLENRRALCTFLSIENRAHYFAYRDSIMAENVCWLIDHFCMNEKVFLWAANVHLAATDIGSDQTAFMGELLYDRFKTAYYNLDVVKSRWGSSYAWNDFTGRRRRSSAVVKVRKIKLLSYKGTCSD